MIIVRLKGGLGNQMFQYAAGLALAERHLTTLKLDVSWFRPRPDHASHNRYALSCLNITEQFATAAEIEPFEPLVLSRTERWSVGLARALRFHRYAARHTRTAAWHVPADANYYAGFAELPDGTALDGYFQSEKFFASCRDQLRVHFSFRYPPTPEVAAVARRIQAGPSVALHFRRGDYARNPALAQGFGVLGLDYYHRALALLRERAPGATAYIFSDEIEAVAAEFKPDGPHEFVRCIRPHHAHDKIRLMALCEHIAIANSTFSWWAAWLNPSPDKLVIVPEPWFTGSPQEPRDIVPKTWTRLPRG